MSNYSAQTATETEHDSDSGAHTAVRGGRVSPPYTLALRLLAWSASSSFAIAERWTSSGPSAKRKALVRTYLEKQKEQGWQELSERNMMLSHQSSDFKPKLLILEVWPRQ